MKKGIVMEIHRNEAILLTKDGSFEKGIILSGGTEVGDEVIFRPVEAKKSWIRNWKKFSKATRISAIFFLLLLLGFPLYKITTVEQAYAYLAMDVNPSLEIRLDADLVVTSIHAINEDADHLLSDITDFNDIRQKPVEAALSRIIDEIEEQGYAASKQLVLGISYKDQTESEVLAAKLDSYVQSLQDWTVSTLMIPADIREIAQGEGRSMNEVMFTQLINNNRGEAENASELPGGNAIIKHLPKLQQK